MHTTACKLVDQFHYSQSCDQRPSKQHEEAGRLFRDLLTSLLFIIVPQGLSEQLLLSSHEVCKICKLHKDYNIRKTVLHKNYANLSLHYFLKLEKVTYIGQSQFHFCSPPMFVHKCVNNAQIAAFFPANFLLHCLEVTNFNTAEPPGVLLKHF